MFYFPDYTFFVVMRVYKFIVIWSFNRCSASKSSDFFLAMSFFSLFSFLNQIRSLGKTVSTYILLNSRVHLISFSSSISSSVRARVWASLLPQATWTTRWPARALTHLGLSCVTLSPCPSLPYSPHPHVYSSPLEVMAALWLLPQAISLTLLFFVYITFT